jgi:hypothetical protein
MFEQMAELVVDLEWPVVVESVQIESLGDHLTSVIQTATNGYSSDLLDPTGETVAIGRLAGTSAQLGVPVHGVHSTSSEYTVSDAFIKGGQRDGKADASGARSPNDPWHWSHAAHSRSSSIVLTMR